MTKQQSKEEVTKGHSIADEELNDDLILHCWNGVQAQVKRVIDFNRQQGVKNPEQWIGYGFAPGSLEPMSVKQKLRWLKIVKHKRTGEFLTLDNLVSSGVISEMELEQVFKDQKFPYISCSAMTRVKTHDGSEYLVRTLRAVGLSDIAAVVSLPLPDADFTRKVHINPTTAKLPDGNDVKVLEVGTSEFYYESSPKIYTTPFTKENVVSTLQMYPPTEETQGQVRYNFERDGVTNGVSISGIDEFLGDFDSIWAARRAPSPTIRLDSTDLLNYVKHDRENREKAHQYG